MLTAHEAAKWFIFNNPDLASGYIDENTKVNKLLYFSNLMYKCVEGDRLISDEFGVILSLFVFGVCWVGF